MKKIKYTVLPLLVFFSFSCTTDTTPCEGEIQVINPIPDMTIKLEDGTHSIDLSVPPVFRHTKEKSLGYFTEVLSGFEILGSGIQKNSQTGEYNLLVLNPRERGEATVYVSAGDGCIEDVRTEFKVTVN